MTTHALPDGSSIEIVTRREWMTAKQLASLAPGRQWDGTPSTYGVVHHTAGNHPTDPAGELREMQAAETWARSKGYWMTGYSAKVGPSGTIYECRGWTYEPAATGAGPTELDPQSHAICYQGNCSTFFANGTSGHTPDPFTDEAAIAIGRWFAAGVTLGFLAPDVKIIGHKQNPLGIDRTGCPGVAIMDKMPVIVRAFFAALTPAQPPAPPPVPPGVGGCVLVVQAGDHAASIGGRAYGSDLSWADRRRLGLSLLTANNLSEAQLRPGQQLRLAGTHPQP